MSHLSPLNKASVRLSIIFLMNQFSMMTFDLIQHKEQSFTIKHKTSQMYTFKKLQPVKVASLIRVAADQFCVD